jgi:hypothetical protein
MANVYYGDGAVSAVTGDWTHIANWYSSLGSGGCCCPSGGVLLGREPAPGDSVVIAVPATPNGSVQNFITTGPAGGWGGPVSWLTSTSYSLTGLSLSAGTYSGAITIDCPAKWGPSVVAALYNGINGATCSGTVSLLGYNYPGGLATVLSPLVAAQILSGTFTGSVTRLYMGASVSGGIVWPPIPNRIAGGTYSPTVNVTLNAGGAVVVTNLPSDPGFAAGGGTYSPTVNVNGNIYPPIGDVSNGITYGPTGANFTGTLVASDILGTGLL